MAWEIVYVTAGGRGMVFTSGTVGKKKMGVRPRYFGLWFDRPVLSLSKGELKKMGSGFGMSLIQLILMGLIRSLEVPLAKAGRKHPQFSWGEDLEIEHTLELSRNLLRKIEQCACLVHPHVLKI